jgi:hypothetical protein
MRRQWIVSLAILVMPGLAWSMAESHEPASGAPADEEVELKIYALRHYPAHTLANVLDRLVGGPDVTVMADENSHRLIVAAPPDRLKQIEHIIVELDTAPARGRESLQMMYRVYMLELPSAREDLKPFSILLERPSQLLPARLLDAVKGPDLQIGSFHQDDEDEDETWELVIQGRAASKEAVMQIVERISESRLKELKWESETLTSPAAQITQLPEQLRGHIAKLLGQEVQTVGYWFGNLSVPGTVEAPIGPWAFQLQVDRSPQGEEVELEMTVVREAPPLGSDPTWQIVSNSVRGHVTKPVIIGYNRLRYGTQTMGALVIVPEASPLF